MFIWTTEQHSYTRDHLSFFMRTAKTLIRLGGCPGWSESLLCVQVILLVLSCTGSFFFELNISLCYWFLCMRQLICIDMLFFIFFMQISHLNLSKKASNCLGRHTQPDICPKKVIYWKFPNEKCQRIFNYLVLLFLTKRQCPLVYINSCTDSTIGLRNWTLLPLRVCCFLYWLNNWFEKLNIAATQGLLLLVLTQQLVWETEHCCQSGFAASCTDSTIGLRNWTSLPLRVYCFLYWLNNWFEKLNIAATQVLLLLVLTQQLVWETEHCCHSGFAASCTDSTIGLRDRTLLPLRVCCFLYWLNNWFERLNIAATKDLLLFVLTQQLVWETEHCCH